MGGTDARRPPAAVERFVKQLVVTMKAVVLYPPASSIPKENAVEAVKLLAVILQDRSEMRLAVQKDGVSYGDAVVYEGQPAYQSFARELYNRGLSEIRFHTGVIPAHVTSFLSILKDTPEEIAAAGGFESRLWELGVDSITVKEAAARIVDTDAAGAELPEGEGWPPDADRIAEILEGAMGGRPRDKRLLVRIVGDSEILQAYLRETLTGRGADPNEALRSFKIAELARAIAQADPNNRAANYRALSEAIAALDPEIRRKLLTERMLPEARTDEHLASVIRHIDIDEVCRWLVEGVTDDQLSVDGLARAIRNLALISLAERDSVANAAGAAMRAAGVSEQTVDDVLEIVSPSTLQVRETGAARSAEPVDSILQLVNLAPGAVTTQYADDPEFAALQEESRRGITDGDVVGALVTLVAVDVHGPEFSAMMSLLEDTLELTIERGDFSVAADAAESLSRVLADRELTANRRERIVRALATLASKRELAVVTKAMRVYDADAPEHKACGRLLNALGSAAIGPLLEILADEPDMTARKALVDTISTMADGYVEELGGHLGDPRWYFVRNVVAILGKTKRPELAGYLNRTLRHPDSRVRRETIRALSGVQDRMAVEMLIAALDDPDAQNVQLAARYLGVTRAAGALPALRQVALGEGRGNRETGPRVEAIEALGRLGSREALPVLEELAGKRALVRAAQVRELRAAAEHAIAVLSAVPGGETVG